ncbi:MAG TPA: hypothetical protein VGK67_27445 [Myxococcales bacterium]|jgi:hypothetical protein
MSIRARAVAVVAALLALAACPDQVDRAAKQRIFSPEEPPKAKLAAAEPIDVDKLAQDGDLTWRVLAMGAPEAFERIGPFKYTASASYQWSFGKDVVAFSEKRSVDQASAAEYVVHTENDKDGGLDVIRMSDRTFARSKYHKFRERKRDRGQSDLVRDDAFAALHSAQSLLSNKLALTRDRVEDVGGRHAKRFGLMVAKEALHSLGPDPWKLPQIQYPAGGPDQPTKRRADFVNLRQPKDVSGTVWIDVETGVPLKVELTATVAAPGNETDDFATLTLKIESELKPVDKVEVAAPAEFLPDQDRPTGVAAALERFDMRKPDAGGAGEPKPKPSEGDEDGEN